MEALFVYGSLAPGKANAHILGALSGSWQSAAVQGSLRHDGWGAELGHPGLDLGASTDWVYGQLFQSGDLAGVWASLDEFEGRDYQRVRVKVELLTGDQRHAWVYALRDSVS